MGEYDNIIKIIDGTADKGYEAITFSNKSIGNVKLMKLIRDYIIDLNIGMYAVLDEKDIYSHTYTLTLHSQTADKSWTFVFVRPKDQTAKYIGLIPVSVTREALRTTKSFIPNGSAEDVTEIIASNALHLNYIDKAISQHLRDLEGNYIGYKMNYSTDTVDFVAKANIPSNSFVESLKDLPFGLVHIPTSYYGGNLFITEGKIFTHDFIEAGTVLKVNTEQLINLAENNTISDEENEDFIQSAILEPVDKEDIPLSRDVNKEICDILNRFTFDDIWISSDWHLFVMNEKTGEVEQNIDSGKYLFNQMQLVNSNHVFLYLGDLADDEITGSNKHDEIKAKLRMMKGKYRILVLGNNDLMDDEYYFECGFDYVVKQIKYKNILFSHHPCDIPRKIVNVHGHIHGYMDYKNCSYKNHIDVYPKRFNDSPVQLSSLLNLIEGYEKEVARELEIMVEPEDERNEDFPVSEATCLSMSADIPNRMFVDKPVISAEYERSDRVATWHPLYDANDISWYRFPEPERKDGEGKQWYYMDPYEIVDKSDVPQYAIIASEKYAEIIKQAKEKNRLRQQNGSFSEAAGFSHFQNRLIINKEYARGDEFSNHDNLVWYRFHLRAPMGTLNCTWYYVDSARVVNIDDVPTEVIEALERQNANYEAIKNGEFDKIKDSNGNIISTERLSEYLAENSVMMSSEIETDDAGRPIKHGMYIRKELVKPSPTDDEFALVLSKALKLPLEDESYIANEQAVISFPKSEHDDIIDRLNQGQICYTTRVSKELGKYRVGVKYNTPWNQPVIIKSTEKYDKLIDHPYYNELTPEQRLEVHKYSERINKPYELIAFQLLKEGAILPEFKIDPSLFSYQFNFSYVTEDKKVPVYVVLTDSKTMMGDIIRKYQNVPYNHASISFDETLKKMYSFVGAGFVAEDIRKSYPNPGARYSVYVTFISKDTVDIVLEQLKKMEEGYKKFKYNIKGIFGFVLNKPIKSDVGYFCSEFVANILKALGVEGKKDSAMTGPYDFVQYKKNLFHVQKGFIKNFNPDKLLQQTKLIYARYYGEKLSEAGRFNIKTEEDGIIFKLRTNESFMEEYDKAHRLLKEYEKSGNVEGMKHELAKLFYIITIIDTQYIHGTGLVKKINAGKLDYAKKSRAFCMNDFKKYLQVVMKKEPDFDFTEYYKGTIYGDESLKIDKNLIGLVKKILF